MENSKKRNRNSKLDDVGKTEKATRGKSSSKNNTKSRGRGKIQNNKKNTANERLVLDTVPVFSLFNNNFLGKILISTLILLLFVAINLLLSGDNLHIFLQLIGIESLIFIILLFFYTYRILQSHNRRTSDTDKKLTIQEENEN